MLIFAQLARTTKGDTVPRRPRSSSLCPQVPWPPHISSTRNN